MSETTFYVTCDVTNGYMWRQKIVTNTYGPNWDIVNNFCLHVSTQKGLIMTSHVTCNSLPTTNVDTYNKCRYLLQTKMPTTNVDAYNKCRCLQHWKHFLYLCLKVILNINMHVPLHCAVSHKTHNMSHQHSSTHHPNGGELRKLESIEITIKQLFSLPAGSISYFCNM